jgi:hypothetical protein
MNCGKCKKHAGLCLISFGIAWGLTMGLIMAVIAWVGWLTGSGLMLIEQVSNFYSGYDASLVGGLWGLLWGFIEGFLMGFFIALFYDLMIHCCKKCCCKKSGEVCNCGPECKCCAGKKTL